MLWDPCARYNYYSPVRLSFVRITVVHNYTTFWEKQKSSILTGVAAPPTTQPTLEGDFQVHLVI